MGQLAGIRYEFFHKGYVYGTRRTKALINKLILKAHDDIADNQDHPEQYQLTGKAYADARNNLLLMEIIAEVNNQ